MGYFGLVDGTKIDHPFCLLMKISEWHGTSGTMNPVDVFRCSRMIALVTFSSTIPLSITFGIFNSGWPMSYTGRNSAHGEKQKRGQTHCYLKINYINNYWQITCDLKYQPQIYFGFIQSLKPTGKKSKHLKSNLNWRDSPLLKISHLIIKLL